MVDFDKLLNNFDKDNDTVIDASFKEEDDNIDSNNIQSIQDLVKEADSLIDNSSIKNFVKEVKSEEPVIYNKRSGKPISEKERLRRLKFGQQARENKPAAIEKRIAKVNKSLVSAYSGDMSNANKKEMLEHYLACVKDKSISLDDAEAVLHVIISEQMKKPERSRENKLVIDATAQLRMISDTKRKIEETSLSVARDQNIMNLFQAWAKIISNYITDPKVFANAISEMREAMNKVINAEHIARTIKNEISDLKQ